MDFGVGCFAGKLSYHIDYNDKLQEAVIMEKRVSKLEADIHEMKTDIAVIKSNYATKSDLHQAINQQTKWIVAGIMSTAGLTLALARWLF